MVKQASNADNQDIKKERRDFLLAATVTVGATGSALALWPFIDSMNPSADVLASAITELDLAPIAKGQRITTMWRGKPVFVFYRTQDQIERAQKDNAAEHPDPQLDENRVQREEWLVVIGICTHLGCVPQGQKTSEPVGEFGGWFCSCHGSHFDVSGRIIKGPAPRNLDVPPYRFTQNGTIQIG